MEMNDLKKGMKFVVVSNKNGGFRLWNSDGEMDKYMGQTLTVKRKNTSSSGNDYVNGADLRWCWYSWMIDWDATAKLNEVNPVDLLETGVVVELRNKVRLLVLKGDFTTHRYGKQHIMFIDDNGFSTMDAFNNDLTSNGYGEDFDIVAIYKPVATGLKYMLEEVGNPIWQRTEVKTIKLTSAELLAKLGLDWNTKIEIQD